MERQLEAQKFHYFDEGNLYAGEKAKEEARACCPLIMWRRTKRPLCFTSMPGRRMSALRRPRKKRAAISPPFSEEGLEQAWDWLEESMPPFDKR